MHVEPFTLADAARVIAYPDTPAPYVEWHEFLALTGARDRTHLGNSLGWSHRLARQPLGAARATFDRVLGVGDETLDEWMTRLAETSISDFVDHHVPFLRNVAAFPAAQRDALTRAFLAAQHAPRDADGHRVTSKQLRAMPDALLIEITESCNFACGICSSRTQGWLRERTMPLPVFRDVVRVLGPAATSVRINGYGETTLVPDLGDYLDCLDELGVTGIREIITNMSAPPAVYRDLFHRGFVVLASWDATSPALFERLRAGARFDELLATLRDLGHVARTARERLALLCTIQDANVGEIVPIVGLAAEVGAGLVIYNMVKEPDGSPWMDARFEEIRARFAEADQLAAARGVRLRIPDHVGRQRLRLTQTHRSSASFCDRPWRELLVRWDTEATVCNMFNPFSYGMLAPPGPPRDLRGRVDRLWEGPNAFVFRQIINREPHPYCADCYFLYP